MRSLIAALLRYRPLVLVALTAWIAAGTYMFLRLDIEAYPDPSPPLVEFITQNPSWSAEEMEQQVTVPVETALFGMPHLAGVRSITIFGLSDVKLYFDYDSDYYWDRQEALNHLQNLSLPGNLTPQLSPESPIGEIYRYRLTGSYSLNELKATEDWFVEREVKQVSGIIDVASFGGTTRQYVAEIEPGKLLQYNVTLPQVVSAVTASNLNAGGNYMTMGSQSVNVRGVGLLQSVADMRNVLISSRNGVPVYLRDVANVHEGYAPRLGQVGVNHDADAIQGIVLLQRGEQSIPALKKLKQKIAELNGGLLPRGMKLVTLYDRTDLIHLTTATVRDIVIVGLLLVTMILIIFLGDVPISLIAALTIPCSLLFAFSVMVLSGSSANLISVGAIDFGILVDAAVIVLENIFRRLQAASAGTNTFDLISEATAEAVRPVTFSVLVIVVALIPLFTMQGVPGKIFAPMSETYGFALTGAFLFATLFAPVLASFLRPEKVRAHHTRLVNWLGKIYARSLRWTMAYRRTGLVIGCGALFLTLIVGGLFLGGEFMPPLEEGNLWVRATLPQDASYETGAKMATDFREILLSFPEVSQVVSQMGRPDDGTDVTTFNNIEFMVSLKSRRDWPRDIDKDKLVSQMDERLETYPGIDFNFSQNIQDNVEEAMSGVKGENSLKLFGDDIDTLVEKAGEIKDVMANVRGVADLGVFQESGQPELLVSIDRTASARYGLMAFDVDSAVQAAIGGIAATQILQGDRRFDFVIRYQPQYRETPEEIRNILLPTPDGKNVPLGQVANVSLHQGAFMIYRENGRRFIPIKFSVRDRDLSSTIQEVQTKLAQKVRIPEGYHLEWAGEYESLRTEQRRLAVVLPISLLIILGLLFTAFNSIRHALLVMVILPFGAIGGVFSLMLTGTPFSISAAVGFASVIGVCTLGGVVFVSGIRRKEQGGEATVMAIERGAIAEMRPVLMACAAAGLGLLPAAVSSGIGVQAQQPLARVVVGGMVTSPLAILFLIPVLASYWLRPRAAMERETGP